MIAANPSLRFSLVTPNRNGRTWLRQCMDSVLDQEYPLLEYIVVDGDSTDGSRILIEEYRNRLARIICEPDTGHADALNKGFAAATGDIMGWINSDDVMLPGALAFVARVFETRPDIEWITGRPSSMNADGDMEWTGHTHPWSRLRFLCGDCRWIQQESTFWRRRLWERAGGRLDTGFQLANDFELWARFFRHAELYSIDRLLGCFRLRPGQRSILHKTRYEAEMLQILKRELEEVEPAFRDAFGPMLPNKPMLLDDAARDKASRVLSICDPPVITPAALRPKARAAAKRRARPEPTFASAIARASAPTNLERFKGVHHGQRCFIMGNGPSLRKTNLDLLKGETVFACNSVFLLFDKINWRPAYYTCVDSRVLLDRAAEICAMLEAEPSITAFFPAEIHEHTGDRRRYPTRTIIPTDRNRFYFREVFGTLKALPGSMFSTDINDHVIQPHTVAITMLQIAAYMGFSEIYLIGCDTRYSVPGTAQAEDDAGLALASTRDDDPNHFDPAYFCRGRKWHAPNTTLMIENYKLARQALEARGIKVFNATASGDLEVFDWVEFRSLFAPDQETHISKRPLEKRSPARQASSKIALFVQRLPAPAKAALYWIWRNRTLIAGFALAITGAAALLAATALAPWRPYMLSLALFILTFAFMAGVAIKSRILIGRLSRQLTELHQREARRALQLIEFESKIEDLNTRIDEIEERTEQAAG
ncbi:MAG: glycosyltransferase [Maricaulaceae bacterium]|nr:glycosyltransferase [Maricaulaceae bacterium]